MNGMVANIILYRNTLNVTKHNFYVDELEDSAHVLNSFGDICGKFWCD